MTQLTMLMLSLLSMLEPTDQHFWYSMETTASAAEIWSIWTDVPHWKNWDTGLQDAHVNGTFDLNATGVIIALGARKSKFKIVELQLFK